MRRFERLTHACSNDSHTRTRARLAHKVQEWVGVGLCPLIGRLGWVLANGRAGSGRRECGGEESCPSLLSLSCCSPSSLVRVAVVLPSPTTNHGKSSETSEWQILHIITLKSYSLTRFYCSKLFCVPNFWNWNSAVVWAALSQLESCQKHLLTHKI